MLVKGESTSCFSKQSTTVSSHESLASLDTSCFYISMVIKTLRERLERILNLNTEGQLIETLLTLRFLFHWQVPFSQLWDLSQLEMYSFTFEK